MKYNLLKLFKILSRIFVVLLAYKIIPKPIFYILALYLIIKNMGAKRFIKKLVMTFKKIKILILYTIDLIG